MSFSRITCSRALYLRLFEDACHSNIASPSRWSARRPRASRLGAFTDPDGPADRGRVRDARCEKREGGTPISENPNHTPRGCFGTPGYIPPVRVEVQIDPRREGAVCYLHALLRWRGQQETIPEEGRHQLGPG